MPEPGGKVHLQGLAAVGEYIKGDLCSLPLHVGDELLEKGGPVHLPPYEPQPRYTHRLHVSYNKRLF